MSTALSSIDFLLLGLYLVGTMGLGWGESQRLTPGERLMRSFMNFIEYNDLGNRLVLEKIRGGD